MDIRRPRFLRCSVSAVQVIMTMLHEKKTEVENSQLKEEMKVTLSAALNTSLENWGLSLASEHSVAICLEDSTIRSVYPEHQRS